MKSRTANRSAYVMVMCLVLAETAKQRTWRGPTHFFDGSAPSSRYGHGFCLAGGNLYVFGGSGNGGSEIPLLFCHQILWLRSQVITCLCKQGSPMTSSNSTLLRSLGRNLQAWQAAARRLPGPNRRIPCAVQRPVVYSYCHYFPNNLFWEVSSSQSETVHSSEKEIFASAFARQRLRSQPGHTDEEKEPAGELQQGGDGCGAGEGCKTV